MNSIQKGEFAQLIYTGDGTVRLEEEIILPDYCPDVARLLRVDMTPVFEKSRAYIQDGAVNVGVTGRAEFTAIYASSEGDCESYSFSVPIDTSYKKDAGRRQGIISDSVAVSAIPFVSTASAKPLTSRKLLARGEIKVATDVFANIEYALYDATHDTREESIETDACERFAAYLTGSVTSPFSVVQDIKIPPTLPSGAKVLSCIASLSVDSCSPSRDSVTAFMTATFNVFYLSEESGERDAEYVSFCQPIELRERIECDDCAEDSVCRIRAMVGEAKCTLESDSFGEMRVFRFELPYTLSCLVFENMPVSLVSDAYGIGCEAECQFSDEEFLRYIGALSEGFQFKKKIGASTDADSVSGVHGKARVRSVTVTGGAAAAHVELNVSAIPRVSGSLSGNIFETVEIDIPLNLPESITAEVDSDNTLCDAVATLSFIDAQMSGGEMEVSGEIALHVQMWEKSRVKFVSDATLSEKCESPKTTLFYYPAPNDTLWSIGKRYGVGSEKLKQINGIENGVLPRVLKIFDGN